MEIPTSLGGKVISIKVSIGDKVSAGSPFLEIEGNEDDQSIDTQKLAIDPTIAPEVVETSKQERRAIEQPVPAALSQDI